jgi:hypothetical protein
MMGNPFTAAADATVGSRNKTWCTSNVITLEVVVALRGLDKAKRTEGKRKPEQIS